MQITTRKENYFYVLAGAFVAVFLVLRALWVTVVHDEIATLYYYVQPGNVFPYYRIADTNNHFLNTALTRISFLLFGSSPLALRLPNLLSIPLYFWGLWRISLRIKHIPLRLTLFAGLAFCLHFVEFMAISRGYGLSFAFLLLSLSYFLSWNQNPSYKLLIYSLLALLLATAANFALVYTYFLVGLLASAKVAFGKGKRGWAIGIILTLGVLPIAFFTGHLIYLRMQNGLVAGLAGHFWSTTVRTFVNTLFNSNTLLSDLIAIIAIIVLIGLAIRRFSRTTLAEVVHSNSFVLLILFVGNIALILIAGWFLKIHFPDDRIVLYLFPLIWLSIAFLLDEVYDRLRKGVRIPMLLLMLGVPLHFFVHFNFSYSMCYKFDVIPQRFYDRVMQNVKQGDYPPTVAGHGLRIFCWSYLDYRHQGRSNAIYFTEYPCYFADYQIINTISIPGWRTIYDSLDFDPVSERHLLHLKKALKFDTLIAKPIIPIHELKNEYVNFLEYDIVTKSKKVIQVDCDLAFQSLAKPFMSRIVADVRDSANTFHVYEYLQLDWMRWTWDDASKHLQNSLLISMPPGANRITIYFWNINKVEFSVSGSVMLTERKMP